MYWVCTAHVIYVSAGQTVKLQSIFVENKALKYRSGTVNSKSFVGKVLLRIKRKFELN